MTAVPDLLVTKTDGGGTTAPGSTVIYTLDYSNLGDQAATTVVLTETGGGVFQASYGLARDARDRCELRLGEADPFAAEPQRAGHARRLNR